MFSADEALGLAMALLTTQNPGQAGLPKPVEQALAKIERVLPPELAERIETIRSEVLFPATPEWAGNIFPQPGVMATLAQARLTRQRVWFRYGRPTGDETAREVDPYGLGNVNGRWYLHGYCHLRKDKRTFRIDRIRRVDLLPQTFELPEGLDVIKAIQESLALSWQEWRVELIIDRPCSEVAEEVPPHFAVLEELDNCKTRLRASTSSLEWFASRILALPFEMEIVSPPELREVAKLHAERILRAAMTQVDPGVIVDA